MNDRQFSPLNFGPSIGYHLTKCGAQSVSQHNVVDIQTPNRIGLLILIMRDASASDKDGGLSLVQTSISHRRILHAYVRTYVVPTFIGRILGTEASEPKAYGLWQAVRLAAVSKYSGICV